MLLNIPAELRALPNWVVWRYAKRNGKTTKIPFQVNGEVAEPNNPATWSTFEAAVAAAPHYSGIGFVLQKHLGYSIIDLDNKPTDPCTEQELERHTKIYNAFNSYTERSVSKTGVHIVVKGIVPTGTNRDHVELYCDGRFMVFTGDVIRNLPIMDYNELIGRLYDEMRPIEDARLELEDRESLLDDAALIEMASNAANADKFNSLCRGEWQHEYTSQSEADLALMAMLAFYSPDNEQCRRLFRMSGLGKREKAIRNNTYLNFTLGLVRGKQPPPIDFSQLEFNVQKMIEESEPEPTPPPIPAIPSIPTIPEYVSAEGDFPPGLIGELAEYFYASAQRPVRIIALASAIAAVAGVCSRSYNISNTGLNQYIILLARTGSGKEEIAHNIERMFSALQPTIPMIMDYYGPAVFASGQGLAKILVDKPCFISVLGEFGITLNQISDPRANSADKMLKKMLLDLYGKSGATRSLQGSVYSDREKNTDPVRAPNVNIIGETVPETFFEELDATHIAEGLIPRFTIIEYLGPRMPTNEQAGFPPSKPLLQRFSDLAVSSISMNNNNTCYPIKQDAEAKQLLKDFDILCDAHINHKDQSTVEHQLWNRAHLKVLRLAGLVAVGVHAQAPVVTGPIARWAIRFIESEVTAMSKRFMSGDIGRGDNKQLADLKKVVESYFKSDKATLGKYGVPSIMCADRIVPYLYLQKKTAGLASFRTDKNGSSSALRKSVQTMLDMGMLLEVPKATLAQKYQFSGQAFVLSSHW